MSPTFGAQWLTKAFHAAGTLSQNNSVTAITSFVELDLQGDNAQGGAGQKAIMTVEYATKCPELHERLFIKVPWAYEVNPKWRSILSSHYGDGDGRELSVYVLAEDLMPVRMPRLYFGDLCRDTSNFILIIECIEYGNGSIMEKCGKYQDKRLKGAHEYYYALMIALARVAAADKQGVFDEIINSFVNKSGHRPLPDNNARRLANRERTIEMFDDLVEFQRLAPNLFSIDICEPNFLSNLRSELVQCSTYFTAATNWVGADDAYTALGHTNLQVDNAFFWRKSDEGGYEAGLLDWYNTTRAPFASIFLGCLSGAEPSVVADHLQGLMECFVSEYKTAGGPKISAEVLLLQYQLLSVQALVGSFSFITSDIYTEGPQRSEWPSVMNTDDPRVMGRWNVRCRTIAIIHQLTIWKLMNLGKIMLAWSKEIE